MSIASHRYLPLLEWEDILGTALEPQCNRNSNLSCKAVVMVHQVMQVNAVSAAAHPLRDHDAIMHSGRVV